MSDPVSVLGFTFDGLYLEISLGLIVVIGGYAIVRNVLAARRLTRIPRVGITKGGTKADHKHAAQVMRKFGRL